MGVEFTKTHLSKMIDVLDQDHKTVEDAAQAALDKAVELYESRAKFAVVGQIFYQNGFLSPEDGRAAKVVLDVYPTQKKAETAGTSLAFSNQTNEQVRWWVVPVWHGTPHAWFKARKEEHQRLQQEQEEQAAA